MMLKKIKKIFGKSKNKRLLSNVTSLSFLQIANYILPLVTLPYLVRVLGPEYVGLLAFATATTAYFILLTDYGFNLSATRQISISREDHDTLIKIFSSVLTIKALLAFVSFVLMSLLIFSVGKFQQDWLVYYLTFGMVIGNMLFPVWLFQGMERMKYIAFLNVFSKALFVAAIFIFVSDKRDYYLVPLFNSAGVILSAVFSLYLAKRQFNICFKFQSVTSLKEQLVEGWHIFFSSLAISVYTISTTFILGIFTSNVVVGYYSVGEKIVKAVQGMYAPISQAVYPYISSMTNKSEEHALKFIRKMSLLVGGVMFLLSSLLFFFAENIVFLILGEQYHQSIVVVQILAFLPFFISLSNIYGIQTMLNFNRKVAFSRILFMASFVGIVLSIILVNKYEHIGSAITLLVVEVFVTVAMLAYLMSVGIKVLKWSR